MNKAPTPTLCFLTGNAFKPELKATARYALATAGRRTESPALDSGSSFLRSSPVI